MSIQPLFRKEELIRPPSFLERALTFVPFIGWGIVAWGLEARRFRPLEEYVDRELASRTQPDPAIWGSDPRRNEVASFACQQIQQEMALVNNHLVPKDSLDVLFNAIWDGLAYVEVLMALEERFSVSISDNEFSDHCGKTLGDLIDYVAGARAA